MAFFIINFTVILFNESNLLNFVLAIASFGFLYPMLLSPPTKLNSVHIDYWGKGLRILVMFQAILGVIQLFSYGFPFKLPYRDFTEDFFAGTLGIGGNRIVANMIAVGLIYFFFCHQQNKASPIRYVKQKMVFLAVCLLMTSSNISLALMTISFMLMHTSLVKNFFGMKRNKASRWNSKFAAIIILAGLTMGFFLSGGYQYMSDTYEKWRYSLDLSDNARLMATKNTLTSLPDSAPYQPLLGIGLGNYSSWAQMILSRDYMRLNILGKHADDSVLSLASENRLASDNILKYYSEDLYRIETQSVLNQPFYSWLAIYGEGGVLFILVFLIIFRNRISNLRLKLDDSSGTVIFKKTLIFYTIFIFLNGFVDNYFEYPWMTMPYIIGLLLLPRMQR